MKKAQFEKGEIWERTVIKRSTLKKDGSEEGRLKIKIMKNKSGNTQFWKGQL